MIYIWVKLAHKSAGYEISFPKPGPQTTRYFHLPQSQTFHYE